MMEHLRRLPDAELMVMQAVWACPAPATSTEIEKHLPADHPVAQTTLLTLLSRLTERGFLTTQKQGRYNVYTPAVTQHDYLSSQSRRFVDQLCGGSLSVFASALCDSGLSKEDLRQLRKLLEEGAL